MVTLRYLAGLEIATDMVASVTNISPWRLKILVFVQALWFSPLLKKPTLSNSNLIWSTRTRFNEFLRTPKCSVGKQITIYNFFWPCNWETPHSIPILTAHWICSW